MPETTMSDPCGQKTEDLGGETFMLSSPSFIRTRRDVLYLSSEIPDHRLGESTDECTPSGYCTVGSGRPNLD